MMNDRRHILVVEDDSRDVELMRASLRASGLEERLVVVSDGEEALDYLACRGSYTMRSPVNPAVVILDIKMPKVDGLQVLRHIKTDEGLKMIPVVMLTSSRQATDLQACYGLGVNAYVVKPLKFKEFKDAIQQLGTFWGKVNEPAPSSFVSPPTSS